MMGGAIVSKTLIQFSVEWQGYVPSLLFDLRPKYGGGNADNGNLFQKVPCMLFCMPRTLQQATRDPWTLTGKSGSVSCGVTALFSWILAHTRFVYILQKSSFPVLCKFWQLCGGVNGDLLQEGFCHTQVYCTQSPCPCSSPLLTCTSAADTQTQFCLSLCRVSGSWCAQGLFEPSQHLWQVWGLILNAILPLLPSC